MIVSARTIAALAPCILNTAPYWAWFLTNYWIVSPFRAQECVNVGVSVMGSLSLTAINQSSINSPYGLCGCKATPNFSQPSMTKYSPWQMLMLRLSLSLHLFFYFFLMIIYITIRLFIAHAKIRHGNVSLVCTFCNIKL